MNKFKFIKGFVAGSACFGVVMLLIVQTSFSQGFISRDFRPRWGDRYENLSNYDLRKYPKSLKFAKPDTQLRRHSSVNAVYFRLDEDPVWNGPADWVTFDRFGNFLLPEAIYTVLNGINLLLVLMTILIQIIQLFSTIS